MTSNSTARDVFLYVLLVIVVGMSAMNLGTLLFQYVNLYVPDVSLQQCYGSSCVDAIRWSLASLIIAFPVMLWVWRFLQRDCVVNPEKLESRIRRWILYFLLFVSGVILLGDSVSLVYSFLQGDLTLQFFLKVVSIAYIAGSLFAYFYRALNPRPGSLPHVIAAVAIGVVCAATVTGFVASGSPFRARMERLDERRISDLQIIQDRLVNVYWISKQVLPSRLAELEDPISGFVVPTDPETQQPYEYTVRGPRAFELCAAFSASVTADASSASRTSPVGSDISNPTWYHGAGRVCFERTIDPQLYPPKTIMQ